MEFLTMKNPKERLTRTREERVSAGFVFSPSVSTDWYWSYQLSWFNGPETFGKLFLFLVSQSEMDQAH